MSVVQRFEHDGVEGLRVGRFKSRINTTCVLYRIGDTIIDTGPPNQWPFTRSYLREREIRRVLLTHHHEDHSGNGSAIQGELGIDVFAPAEGLDHLSKGYTVHLYRRIVWGKPRLFEAAAVPDQLANGDGLRIVTIRAHGHSDDLVCYLVPEKGALFTGDLFVASKPQYLRVDENPLLEMESLRLILRQDFRVIFCAHRGIVPDGRKALQEKLDYLEALRERVRDLLRHGQSVPEIARRVLGKDGFLCWLSGGHFSKANMIAALARGGS
ncbi:MAG: MBL fold metallo-hydrolase [Acidobacteriota bacterium]